MSTLVVTGAGSLAHATLLALSQCPGPIEIVARDSERLHGLARTVRARSAVAGHLVDVRPYAIDWDDPRSLASILARTKPRVVLHTASWQSAWTLAGADAWSALVRGMGYGVTFSLHLRLNESRGFHR